MGVCSISTHYAMFVDKSIFESIISISMHSNMFSQ